MKLIAAMQRIRSGQSSVDPGHKRTKSQNTGATSTNQTMEGASFYTENPKHHVLKSVDQSMVLYGGHIKKGKRVQS